MRLIVGDNLVSGVRIRILWRAWQAHGVHFEAMYNNESKQTGLIYQRLPSQSIMCYAAWDIK